MGVAGVYDDERRGECECYMCLMIKDENKPVGDEHLVQMEMMGEIGRTSSRM